MTREQGRLAEWNDDRGFGFITPIAGGPRVFVHVSAFPRGQRPTAHELVTYSVRRDARNRLGAADVQYAAHTRSPRATTRGVPTAITIVALFCTLLVSLAWLERVPVLLLAAYGALSVVAFTTYRADKAAAVRGGWRTPEANLHAIAVLGGWPGALLARQVFRHKTTKQPFRTIFWVTVMTNCAALGWFASIMPLHTG
jgi:uncharacterized membrane protein YsdA (DUF1294 family)/cold shock CspA family protein